MSPNLETLLANIDHAVRNNQKTLIGGGVFVPSELRWHASEIRRLQEANARLDHDNKLMQAALKRYIDDPMSLDTKTGVHAAYRHVTGT